MKFEKPIMKISKFNRENVLTASGETPASKPTLAEALAGKAGSVNASQNADWDTMVSVIL